MSSSSSTSTRKHDSNARGEQQEILEDGPEYRSVMISPLAPPPMHASFASPQTTKFPRPAYAKTATVEERKSSTTNSTTKSSSWTISQLTSLPAGYLLERSNVYVENAAQTCADRICECLRTLNIAARPGKEDDLAMGVELASSSNLLRAETHDGVKFAVRLFQDQGMVVVEVQRVAGCSFGFREASRAVLRSAQGLSQLVDVPRRQFTIPPALPERSLESQHACVRDDLEIALKMLQSTRYDSQSLALETLEQLTKSCAALSIAARSVLSSDCLIHLVALLQREAEEGSQSSVVTRKVLAILANSFEALDSVDLTEIICSSEHIKEGSFLSVLLSTLRDASERPHDAYQAARCLSAILISKEVEKSIVQMSCMEVVESARNAGCNSHHALEQETQKLISQLRNICCQ